MSRRGPSHSSPYGLACQSCFKAKCKCVARPDGDGCQRCHRLEKECYPSSSFRRRTIEKKHTSNNRISDLENKLDGLISQLQARHVLEGDSAREQYADGEASQHAEPILAEEHDTDTREAERIDHAQGFDFADPDLWSPTAEPIVVSGSAELPPSDVDIKTSLDTFRSLMLPHFPFIRLPAESRVERLRESRPFMLQCIVCVASLTAGERKARVNELKSVIGQTFLDHQGQPTIDKMDLLLGILIYIAWGWDHVLNRCSLSRLMMQAVSLACEMRLDKPASQDSQIVALLSPRHDVSLGNAETMTTEEFLERQRVVLACFALSCAVSAHFGEVDAMRWTTQMEHGLAAVSTNKCCSTDSTFAIQIRLQVFTQRVAQIQQDYQAEQRPTPTESAAFMAHMSIENLQTQLLDIQKSSPQSNPQRSLILAHIYATELGINEARYTINSTVPLMVRHFALMTASESASAGYDSDLPSEGRSQPLWQCVCAIKACASVLLDLSPSDFSGSSFLQWAHLAQCIAGLNRLTTTIKDPTWDCSAFRSHIDMPIVLDRITEKLRSASQASNMHGASDAFAQLACAMDEFGSSTTSQERTVAEEADSALSRSRQYGGLGAGSPVRMRRLIGIMGGSTVD